MPLSHGRGAHRCPGCVSPAVCSASRLQALGRARVLAQLRGGQALERPELLVQAQQVHLVHGGREAVLHGQLVEEHPLSREGHLLLLHLTVGHHLLHVHHQLQGERGRALLFCYESHAISRALFYVSDTTVINMIRFWLDYVIK